VLSTSTQTRVPKQVLCDAYFLQGRAKSDLGDTRLWPCLQRLTNARTGGPNRGTGSRKALLGVFLTASSKGDLSASRWSQLLWWTASLQSLVLWAFLNSMKSGVHRLPPGAPMSLEEQMLEVAAYVVAGFETSASTIGWCL
jgi:hypothetical protein